MYTNLEGSFCLMPQVVLPYVPPSPPAGVHRYVFSLFQQPSGAAIDVSHSQIAYTCHRH